MRPHNQACVLETALGWFKILNDSGFDNLTPFTAAINAVDT